MSSALFTQQLKEARRDALVSHYIANHDFSGCSGNINNANDLYEYLLLDTKISDHVITTPLSEGINSLQLAIHRAMEGYDGNLATTAQSWFAEDAFLANWDRYNKRYSTWAGKEKLRFYAGNYINPTLRTNKSSQFKEAENSVNRGKLTANLVENALLNYVSNFDRIASIKHLCASIANSELTHLYITGRQNNGQYYWREVWLDKSIHDFSKPIHWSCWQSLPAAIKSPINDSVVMTNSPQGVLCLWSAMERIQSSGGTAQDVEVSHCWLMRHEGQWEQYEDAIQLRLSAPKDGWGPIIPVEFSSYNIERNSGYWYYDVNGTVKWDDRRKALTVSVTKINNPTYMLGLAVFTLEDHGSYYKVKERLLTIGEHETKSIAIPFDSGEIYALGGWRFDDYVEHSDPLIMSLENAQPNTWQFGNFKVDDNLNVWLNLNSGHTAFTVASPSVSLNSLLKNGIESFLSYNNQKMIAEEGTWLYKSSANYPHPIKGGDAFTGPYGLCLWEIFFHLPFLFATRLQTEQRFEEAYTWYKYIFNSAGYRDVDGSLLLDNTDAPRYWNCYPLQHDTGWDSELLPSSDPDAIAMADPMHYKLAIFLHTLDLLITRGDTLYRQLERDTLAEAKMYYMQAQQLLGPRPDIRQTNSWPAPTLSEEAGNITTPLTAGEPVTFVQWLRAGDAHDMGDGHFLPPYNNALLAYWDKLELRLYNLRHNLSLNGQPLSLRLYATPMDPAELHRQQSGGDGPQGEVAPGNHVATGWRYPLLSEFARSAVSQLMQFGSSLQNALERQDNERMTLLLQTQQVSVLGQQQEVAQKNLDSLTASLKALRVSHETATLHKTHYDNLLNGGLSAGEITALTLRSTSMASNLVSIGTAIAGGALSAVPNTFGLANGGGDFGAPLHAATQVTQTLAHTLDQSATISDITAGYQRRAEEWMLQRNSAEKEQAQLTAQIDSLQQQIVMAQKQMALNELEAANAQEQYELQVSRFTGQALYNWLAGRLSALYYQQYDATLPVCLQARAALEQELGKGLTDKLFRTPVWDDLWQGLLAGEGLNVELQKLSNIWLENSAKGLEATRTVSLAAQREEPSGSLRMTISQILADEPDTPTRGVELKLTDGMFIAELTLAELGLDKSYNMDDHTKTRFVKNIAVTLPTLLGPYQDIEATLQLGDEIATLSHGMNDSGRFVTNFEGSQLLPFEGADPTTGTLTLTLFNVKKDGAPAAQYATVENLSDIIFHIHYILRDKA
ncbi:neuraminidase-like domain-containing protein [Aeromonas sp. HMWF014]|uniref:Tc toxin subunit A-related protein n=1 Tax=Aeromonas sp. HMWF014 TaxID=2056850 RepID=UPI0011B1CDF4|nr:neuraminidase-like domain-containing protein [Aeromonas sp. HMWF014]